MTRRTTAIAATVFGTLWLLGLAAYPLLESTEGRYASIAWDMAHGGSWLTPSFNGLALFTKPPLAYWAGATALETLPNTEWAVRLPATFALLLCGFLTMRLARQFGHDRKRSHWAGLVAVLSPLAMVQGHMTTGDIFLWTGILLIYVAVLNRRRDLSLTLPAGLGLAVGFMAKGHMVLFWTVIPLGAWALSRHGTARPLLRLIHPLTLLVFVALAAPWFAAVLHRYPELASYWLGHETADRLLSRVHGRAEPWWYFLPQVPLLMLPWLPELWRGLRRRAADEPERDSRRFLLLLWIVVPLIIFSLSGSKRPNYLLPMVTPLALLVASGIPATPGRSLRVRTGTWLAVALVWPFLLGGLKLGPPTKDLVRQARTESTALACYQVMPSSIVFYHRGPVETFSFPRDTRFGGQTLAPARQIAAANRLLDRGGTILTTNERLPSLEKWLGRQVGEKAEVRGSILVGPRSP